MASNTAGTPTTSTSTTAGEGGVAVNGLSAIDTVLPPIDDNAQAAAAPPGRGACLALVVALILEATVPSLNCYWGVLLVFWASPTGSPATSLQSLKAAGFFWTPVLFSASWSVAEPWSETLSTVHGHPRVCALVGGTLLSGGLLVTALGAVLSPRSALLPLLSGLTAGITAGVGASLLARAARLVVSQRWGERTPVAKGSLRFVRALGLTMAPLTAIAMGQRYGPGGALMLVAALSLHALIAPVVLKLKRAKKPKYDRVLQRSASLPAAEDDDVQTESSDDGGSISGHPPLPSNPGPQARAEDEDDRRADQDVNQNVSQGADKDADQVAGQTTVVAEVHCDVAGERQAAVTLSPAATARLSTERGFTVVPAPRHVPDDDLNAPRPLYGEGGQPWNIAYSFDCDGDDDIELFVKRLSPKRGPLARLCSSLRGWGSSCCPRGCRADLRPLLRPAFHLSLCTLACCRLAALSLAVLVPSIAVAKLGDRARTHLMAALPAVAGVGGILFGLGLHWMEGVDGEGRARRRFLSVVSAVSAAGFFMLSWGQSQWWLMLGCLTAGYGSSGVSWAQRYASRDAMGGATSYRAQPLLSVLTGFITVFASAFCNVDLSSCMTIMAGMFTVISALWLIQPHIPRFC